MRTKFPSASPGVAEIGDCLGGGGGGNWCRVKICQKVSKLFLTLFGVFLTFFFYFVLTLLDDFVFFFT